MSSKYSTISFKCGTTTSLASWRDLPDECTAGMGKPFATWESFLKSDPRSSPNIKCVRHYQGRKHQSMKPKYCMFQAELQVRFDVVKPAGHQLCKASAGCPSSGMVDNYQHLPVKDMAISGKIEANGYSPCQTILFLVLNPMVAWGSPMTSETNSDTPLVIFTRLLSMRTSRCGSTIGRYPSSTCNSGTFLSHGPMGWDFHNPSGKSTVSPSMGTDSFPSDFPLKRAHLKVTFGQMSHTKSRIK